MAQQHQGIKRSVSSATLAALERAGRDPAACPKGGQICSSKPRGPDVTPEANTPTKRSRLCSFSGPDIVSPQPSSASNSPAPESICSGSSCSIGTITKPGKHCLGCRRVTGVDFAYQSLAGQPRQDVSWYYKDGRADWCNTCMRVYNSCYKSSMSIVVFESWLKAQENHDTFSSKVVAFQFCIIQGIAHVRREHIERAESHLRTIFSLCGVPFPFFRLAPKEHALLTSGSHLVEYKRTPKDVEVLAAVPCGFGEKRDDSRSVLSGQVEDATWPFNPLGFVNQEFQQWFKSLPPAFVCPPGNMMLDEGEGENTASQPSESVQCHTALLDPAEQKVVEQHKSMLANVVSLLVVIVGKGGAQGRAVKEKDIGSLITKCVMQRDQVLKSRFSLHATKYDTCMDVLASMKTILKPLRLFVQKNELKGLERHAVDLRTVLAFVQTHKGPHSIDPVIAYALLKLDCQESATFNDKLARLTQYCDEHADTSGALSPDCVVQDVISDIAYEYLFKPLEEEEADLQFQGFVEAVAVCEEYVLNRNLNNAAGGFLEALQAMGTLAKAAGPRNRVPALQVKKAFTLIDVNKHAVRFKAGLANGELGQAIAAEASVVSLKGDLEEQEQESWADGLKLLFAQGMVEEVQSEGEVVDGHFNCGYIMFDLNGSEYCCCRMIEEMMEVARPVFLRGSMVASSEDFGSQLIDALHQIKNTMACLDVCATHRLLKSVFAFREALVGHLSQDGAAWPPSLAEDAADAQHNAASAMFSELATATFHEKLESFLTNVVGAQIPEGQCADMFDELEQVLRQTWSNRDVRRHLLSECLALRSLLQYSAPEATAGADVCACWDECACSRTGFFHDLIHIIRKGNHARATFKFQLAGCVKELQVYREDDEENTQEKLQVLDATELGVRMSAIMQDDIIEK